MKSFIYKLGFCFSLLIFASSCNDDDNGDYVFESPYRDTSVIDTLSVNLVKTLYAGILTQSGWSVQEIEPLLTSIKYDVVVSKVEYRAIDPFGAEKTLSGLVAYPVLPDADKAKGLSIVSIQHGTLTLPTQAPSNINTTLPGARDILGLVAASHNNGFISVQPDFFGYGTDENNIHYYEHAESLAEATRKLIESTPAYADKKSLTVDYDKLYLMGYSEGGGASVATLKSFSERGSWFKDYVTVSGSGAYDKPATVEYILQQTTGDSPQFSASYAWVALTYNYVYGIDRDVDKIFDPEVAPELQKYVGNNKIMTTQALPAAPAEVFNTRFTAGILDGTDKEFIETFHKNDISDFQAKGDISLICGTEDGWVPPFNTENFAQKLQKRGITPSLTVFNGGNHTTTYLVFFGIASQKFYQ